MNKYFPVIAAISLLLMAACNSTRTVTTAVRLNVPVTSDPSGADVILNGNRVGTTPCVVELPLRLTTTYSGGQASAAYEPMKLVFTKNGHAEEATFTHQELSKGMLFYPFRQKAYVNDPTIVVGEAGKMVSRDNPGSTALEGTILRWYFDSEPRGARIYWRVISSIPQVVKNTNETYLMTTPYEETRAFNILGLTYENSRDVQIEIKVVKNGYEPQVKRYNVRQAIDQQEISGFFELVKKEPVADD